MSSEIIWALLIALQACTCQDWAVLEWESIGHPFLLFAGSKRLVTLTGDAALLRGISGLAAECEVDGESLGWRAIGAHDIQIIQTTDAVGANATSESVYVKACTVDFSEFGVSTTSSVRALTVRLKTNANRQWEARQLVSYLDPIISIAFGSVTSIVGNVHVVTQEYVDVVVSIAGFPTESKPDPRVCLQLGASYRDCHVSWTVAVDGSGSGSVWKLAHRIVGLLPGQHELHALLLAPSLPNSDGTEPRVLRASMIRVVFAPGLSIGVGVGVGAEADGNVTSTCAVVGAYTIMLRPTAVEAHRSVCVYSEHVEDAIRRLISPANANVSASASTSVGGAILIGHNLEWLAPRVLGTSRKVATVLACSPASTKRTSENLRRRPAPDGAEEEEKECMHRSVDAAINELPSVDWVVIDRHSNEHSCAVHLSVLRRLLNLATPPTRVLLIDARTLPSTRAACALAVSAFAETLGYSCIVERHAAWRPENARRILHPATPADAIELTPTTLCFHGVAGAVRRFSAYSGHAAVAAAGFIPFEQSRFGLVVVRVDDELSWIDRELAGVEAHVYDKRLRAKPEGATYVHHYLHEDGARECSGYLRFIIDHYDSLPDVTAFVHGSPAPHLISFGQARTRRISALALLALSRRCGIGPLAAIDADPRETPKRHHCLRLPRHTIRVPLLRAPRRRVLRTPARPSTALHRRMGARAYPELHWDALLCTLDCESPAHPRSSHKAV